MEQESPLVDIPMNWKSFIHNCLVHPLLMLPFLSDEEAHALHDRNAGWAYGTPSSNELLIEDYLWVRSLSDYQLSRLTQVALDEVAHRRGVSPLLD